MPDPQTLVQQMLQRALVDPAIGPAPPGPVVPSRPEGGAFEGIIDTLLGALGIGPETKANVGGQLISAAVPVVGGIRNALGTGLKAAMPEAKAGIKAYHGSPHDFDRFSTAKIGTGEGAQAYGHGLYFAEREGVAKAYREQLATPTVEIMGQAQEVPRWYSGMSPQPRLIRHLADTRSKFPNADESEIVAKVRETLLRDANEAAHDATTRNHALAQLDILKAAEERGLKTAAGGKTYEVAIKADPEDFLDWDKPIGQQSPKVQATIQRMKAEGVIPSMVSDQSPARVLMAYGIAPEHNLHRFGVPGIKYFDQGSRTAGEGSRNYVVFDDQLVDILRKYGLLPGAILLGAASGAEAGPNVKRATHP